MDKNRPQIKRLFEELQSNSDKEVTVYSIEGCPSCEELKSKFRKMEIDYNIVEMENNEPMWDKLMSMGGSEYVPQVMVESKLIVEYDTVNELISKTVSEIIERNVILK